MPVLKKLHERRRRDVSVQNEVNKRLILFGTLVSRWHLSCSAMQHDSDPDSKKTRTGHPPARQGPQAAPACPDRSPAHAGEGNESGSVLARSAGQQLAGRSARATRSMGHEP